jgi:hypothetical protein
MGRVVADATRQSARNSKRTATNSGAAENAAGGASIGDAAAAILTAVDGRRFVAN